MIGVLAAHLDAHPSRIDGIFWDHFNEALWVPEDLPGVSGEMDLDGDGIFNDEEIRAGSNPAVRDSVPGMVIDDLWSKVPGDRLDERAYQVAFTRPISVRTAHVAMLIHHGGSEFVRRVRGFITPPAGGTYTFWLGSSGESSFSLSTTTSKFDRKLLISTTYGQGGAAWLGPFSEIGPRHPRYREVTRRQGHPSWLTGKVLSLHPSPVCP